MKKVLSAILLSVLFFLFGIFFFLNQVHAEPKRITCEEWMSIVVLDECKYYNTNTKEKNQIKDLEVYCFSEPAVITDRGSSHDFEINSRPPDYIAAFEWDKCGVGGSGGNKTTSSSNSKFSSDSLDCEAMVKDINKGGAPIGYPYATITVQKKIIDKNNGSFCRVTVSEPYENIVKITYFSEPQDKIPQVEDKDFKVIKSDGKSYSGVTLKGKYSHAPAPDTFPYWYDPTNYVKEGTLLENCLLEATTVLSTEQQLRDENHLREFMIDSLNLPKMSLMSLLSNPDLKNFCSGKGGGSSKSIFSPISNFFSNFFSSILSIFKPSPNSTLGTATSTQGVQSQQLLTLVVIGAIVGLFIWSLARKKTLKRKQTKRRKRK